LTAEVSEVLEVRIDCSVLMLADAVGDWPAFPVFLHRYVRDVDASYRRAIELGATPVQEPRQQEGDPDRHGGVKGPAGNTWWISTQLGRGARSAS
jgi:PhnB protein